MGNRIVIEPDIRQASTLPASFYRDADLFERTKESIFARSWQLVGDTDSLKAPGQIVPLTLLEGFLDEPLILTRDHRDQLHCLSNVCTHRGTILVEGCTNERAIQCRYHGRRFALDGRFLSMPEFDQVENFPSENDHLPQLAMGQWDKFIFASLAPAQALDEVLAEMKQRVGWLPLPAFHLDLTRSRDYLVHAHWALYCENYLEGFHLPYVHHDLAAALDYGNYRTELFAHGNLQVGIGKKGARCFDLPKSSPDYGQDIAAYYFWLFPNTMFNFYPWGLSVNIVKPLSPDRCKVSFLPYVYDASLLDQGAGGMLDKVEREDESVVEAVQRGMASRLYDRGRYSPTQERGVHHFHRLLADALNR